jgi:hypothetical protein
MKRMVEQARHATGGRTVSTSSMRVLVRRYWRKLANAGAQHDHGRRPKRVSDFKVHHTDSLLGKKLQQSERMV